MDHMVCAIASTSHCNQVSSTMKNLVTRIKTHKETEV